MDYASAVRQIEKLFSQDSSRDPLSRKRGIKDMGSTSAARKVEKPLSKKKRQGRLNKPVKAEKLAFYQEPKRQIQEEEDEEEPKGENESDCEDGCFYSALLSKNGNDNRKDEVYDDINFDTGSESDLDMCVLSRTTLSGTISSSPTPPPSLRRRRRTKAKSSKSS